MQDHMKDVLRRYGVAVLVVAGLLGLYRGYQTYKRLTWLLYQDSQSKSVFAIPAFQK